MFVHCLSRRLVRLSLSLFLLPGAGLSQSPPTPVSCFAQAATTPTIRAEGVTELLGDIVIKCTGGQPTPQGQPLPTVNLQLYLTPSINLTSRILNSSSGLTEALLFVDEPTPAQQSSCLQPGGSCVIPPMTGTGNGVGTYDGSAGRLNGFYGSLNGPNSLIWPGVPFDPPGQQQQERVFRITNLRVNASQVSVGASRETVTISVFPTMTPGPGAPIINLPFQGTAVGTTQRSMSFGVTSRSLGHCTPSSPQLPGQPASEASSVRLRYTELFPTVFRRRNVSAPSTPESAPPDPVAQDVLNSTYATESGFMKSPAPNASGTPGLADHGTRLIARFNNVQTGVQIWVQTAPRLSSAGTQTGTARLISTDPNGAGPFSSISPSGTFNYQSQQQGLARVTLQNGSGIAVWEIVDSTSDKIENLDISTIVSFNANGTFAGSPAEGTINVELFPGPLAAPGGTLLPGSVPRFYAPPAPLSAANNVFPLATLHSCSGAQKQLSFASPFAGVADPGVLILAPKDGPLLRTINIPVLSKNGPATISAAPFAETLAQITVEGARAATSNWLQALVNNSSTPATVTASFDPQGLPPGDYLGRIDITSAQAPGPPLQLKFTLRVSSSGPFFWPGSVFQAASYTAGFLSPGAATTIFGLRFGPPSPTGLTLGPDNRVTTAAGQTRVLIDGVPAPMIFAVGGSFSQLSFFAPFSLAGKTSAQVQVEYQGVASNPVTLPVIDVAPGLFTVNSQGFGPGAILNQDTSLNSAQNPARRGEVIVLYGTGYGRTNPTGVDGQQAAAPLPAPLQPISVRIDGKDAVIQYQGSAPQLTEGIFQLNVVIPVDVTPGAAVPIELRQGGKTSIAGPTVAISAN